MSSVGPSELFLLFIIGVLILGPERLPRVASQIGRWVGRARRTANQLRYQLEREIAEAERQAPTQAKPERRDNPAAKKLAEPPTTTDVSGESVAESASAAAEVPAAPEVPATPGTPTAGEPDQKNETTPG